MPRRARHGTALLEWEERLDLRLDLLRRYGADPAFGKQLQRFFESQRELLAALPTHTAWEQLGHARNLLPPEVQVYVAALEAFVRCWGLANFTGATSADKDYGYEAVHLWCECNAHLQASLLPAQFGEAMGGAGMVPDVGEIVSREEHVVAIGAKMRAIAVDERREPIVRVELVDRWNAASEPRADAKERLRVVCERLIDAELDRLEGVYREAGYTLQDTQHARQKHMRWLYRRLAYRETCDSIAGQELLHHEIDYNSDTIQKETKALADRLGVTIPRPRRAR